MLNLDYKYIYEIINYKEYYSRLKMYNYNSDFVLAKLSYKKNKIN